MAETEAERIIRFSQIYTPVEPVLSWRQLRAQEEYTMPTVQFVSKYDALSRSIAERNGLRFITPPGPTLFGS